MQTKPSDTPKVIALLAATVLVMGLVIWQIAAAGRSSSAPSPAPLAAGTAPSAPQLIATSDVVPGPGEIRDTELVDLDRMDEQQAEQLRVNPVQGGPLRSDVFRVIEAPLPAPPIALPLAPAGAIPASGQPLLPSVGATDPQPIPQYAWQPVTREITVDGIVTGEDGFAMISVDGRTLYKRAGETLEGYTITRLSETGVVVKKKGEEPALWPVGETTRLTTMARVLASEASTPPARLAPIHPGALTTKPALPAAKEPETTALPEPPKTEPKAEPPAPEEPSAPPAENP